MHRAPRVAFVIDDLGHGGAQRQLSLLVGALAGHVDARVFVLSARTEPYAGRLAASGTDVVAIRRRAGLDVARALALAGQVSSFDADIVHGFLDAADVYAFLAARRTRRPAVLSLRSDRVRLHGMRGAALRWMLRHADAVTVNSRAGREYLLRTVRVPDARVLFTPNLVAAAAGTRRLPAQPTVVFVGRLAAVKRVAMLLDAVAIARAAVPGLRVCIVGDGPLRGALSEQARTLGLDGTVTFAGEVEDASAFIAAASCLAVTSAHEGLPNAALEALALGVPVVAVPAGDLPDVIEPGVTGIVAAGTSAEAVATALVTALETPGLAASAATAGPRSIRERFPGEPSTAALLDLYARVTRRR